MREAHLAKSEEWAARALRSQSLEQLVAAAAPRVEARAREGQPFREAVAEACGDLDVRLPTGEPLGPEVIAQLAPQVVVALGGGDFLPDDVRTELANQQAEEEEIQEERGAVLVLNVARGVVHRLAVAQVSIDAEHAANICGWQCGEVGVASYPDASDIPAGFRSFCGRCLPRWRALRERREAAVMGALRV